MVVERLDNILGPSFLITTALENDGCRNLKTKYKLCICLSFFFFFFFLLCRAPSPVASPKEMALPYLSDNDLGWLDFLGKEGRDYCVTHGMMYKDAKDLLQHIPFTLFPSPFPRRLFQEAKDVQTDFNLLVHQVSQDYEFIKNALSR